MSFVHGFVVPGVVGGVVFLVAPSGNAQSTMFGPQQLLSTEAIGAEAVAVGDIDGDGDVDVISASRSAGVAWYMSQGGGAFGPSLPIGENFWGASDVALADLDGDGDLDAVYVRDAAYDMVLWIENEGGGSFGPSQVISVLAKQARAVAAADLDGDGDKDVLTASGTEFNQKIAWYENLGGGSFGGQVVIDSSASFRYPTDVCAADLDGDGDLEVLATSLFDDTVAWFENLGSGAFGPRRVVVSPPNSCLSVEAADLDDDGDLDVLFSSEDNPSVAWCENLGGGSFSVPNVLVAIGFNSSDAKAMDLDCDGDLDVVGASRSPDRVVWLENLGGGNFGPQMTITTSAQSTRCLAVGDLTGDGYPEVVSASFGDNTVAWYENLPPDCNANGVPDTDDITNGTERDCNGNGIPDSCDLTTLDCDWNGLIDPCELAAGTATDCDSNGLIDSCEIAADSQLDRNQDAILDACQYVISNYCLTSSNTSGNAATMSSSGLPSVVLNEFTLEVQGAALQKFGLFFIGPATQSIFVGEGLLCVSDPQRIYPLLVTDATGAASLPLDLTSAPLAGTVQAFDTHYFQFWFRDPLGGPAGFNFSDGLEVEFCQ